MLRRLLADERGTSAIEYAILACLVSVAAMTGINAVSGGTRTLWSTMAAALESARP